MKGENLANEVMKEFTGLGLASNPDVPMFKKNIERLAAELYEFIDEGEFRKAHTVVSKLEATVITFVNALWYHGNISIVVATAIKEKFSTFADAKRDELWDKARRKDDEEFKREAEQRRHEFEDAYQRSAEESIDYDEFDRHINEKLQEIYREYDKMQKSMKSSKPSAIIIIMK